MDRRKNIKALLLGTLSVPFIKGYTSTPTTERSAVENIAGIKKGSATKKESSWHKMADMAWAGPDYWTNRLQDWSIKDRKLECQVQGANRTVHCLTHQLGSSRNRFNTVMQVKLPSGITASNENRIGFLLGAKSDFQDYRAAAIKGKGLKAGINTQGNLFIGSIEQEGKSIALKQLQEGIFLEAVAEPLGMQYVLRLTAYNQKNVPLAQLSKQDIEPKELEGNIALLSDFNKVPNKQKNKLACTVSQWNLEGEKFEHKPSQVLGPVCFAQYTQEQGVLKLTAQLMPVNLPNTAFLEIKEGEKWKKIAKATIDYPSYTARFRINNWNKRETIPYRISFDLQFKEGETQPYFWEGAIAAEPLDKEELKALVCSCNFDYGFPDQEIVDYASMHNPDVVMFLGDQFYEPNGGFGIQRNPLEKAYLDYLRKWYQFGWSYRELFRNRPTINLPDDHDVFQGNLFGAGGKEMPENVPSGLQRDYGGFTMDPEWVNLVMTTQTSHMPDPYDPEPVKQGIHVFYTDWKYAGISFGIIEDRKFKSGPAAVLPKEAQVRDGFILNEDYDVSQHNYPEAELVGERQLQFLKHWVEDWDHHTELKVLLSATPFHALQTLPNGAQSNGQHRKLYVPKPGEYVEGDEAVADMDSGGWPQSQRDELLRIIRKAFAVHLTGDQHLPSLTQYGVEDWQDAGLAFAVPALGNSWPRRWWPPVSENHQPLPGQPAYTGNFKDGFGNKMHVIAVGNPHKTGLKPDYLYDRSPGYGIVTFNKNSREIKMECWPRYINPQVEPDKQFKGWPVTVQQLDNLNPSKANFLPTLKIQGAAKPVVKITNTTTGETEHILRIQSNSYQPKVQTPGVYSVEIYDDSGNSRRIEELKAMPSSNAEEKVIEFNS